MPLKSHLHNGHDIMQLFHQLKSSNFALTELPASSTKHAAKCNSILCQLWCLGIPFITIRDNCSNPWKNKRCICLQQSVGRLYSIEWQDDKWTGKDLEGSSHRLNLSIILTFSLRDWGKQNSCQDSQCLAGIWIKHLLNISLELYQYTGPLISQCIFLNICIHCPRILHSIYNIFSPSNMLVIKNYTPFTSPSSEDLIFQLPQSF
jgi:hypothetical protein